MLNVCLIPLYEFCAEITSQVHLTERCTSFPIIYLYENFDILSYSLTKRIQTLPIFIDNNPESIILDMKNIERDK